MNPQLQSIADEFHAASARLDRLSRDISPDQWPIRADPNRWSVGECVAHLNLTGRAYVGDLAAGVDRARALERQNPGTAAGRRYRRDFLGWLLWRTMGPPVRMRVRTTAPFIPSGQELPAALLAEFKRLQERQLELLGAADGLPLSRVRVVSPFNARVGYNLYSAFSLLPRHQHRHLWQAEST